jgi:SAM-dependent methyltransferase
MERYEPATYGDRIADVYDMLYPPGPDAEDAAELLATVAGSGRALELGIGTGRVALPLSARGVDVHGIDVSEAMAAQLRAKPGGEGIPVTIADFTDVPAEGHFELIFVAFNTFFVLMTQEAQVRCLRAVAEHLAPGGAFVIEAFVPDPARYDRGQRTATSLLGGDWIVLESTVHDAAVQRVRSVHVFISAHETRLYPVELRYCWPSELDLMARLAGLRLEHRWAGWRREEFTASSPSHISVYRPG